MTTLDFVAAGIIVIIAVWVGRYALSVLRGNFRHAEGSKQVWWVPGGGGHGGGGQVPPIVSNSEHGA